MKCLRHGSIWRSGCGDYRRWLEHADSTSAYDGRSNQYTATLITSLSQTWSRFKTVSLRFASITTSSAERYGVLRLITKGEGPSEHISVAFEGVSFEHCFAHQFFIPSVWLVKFFKMSTLEDTYLHSAFTSARVAASHAIPPIFFIYQSNASYCTMFD